MLKLHKLFVLYPLLSTRGAEQGEAPAGGGEGGVRDLRLRQGDAGSEAQGPRLPGSRGSLRDRQPGAAERLLQRLRRGQWRIAARRSEGGAARRAVPRAALLHERR
ncbi:hypothetical protein COLO4_03081, partial [Corchorus olitorius]